VFLRCIPQLTPSPHFRHGQRGYDIKLLTSPRTSTSQYTAWSLIQSHPLHSGCRYVKTGFRLLAISQQLAPCSRRSDNSCMPILAHVPHQRRRYALGGDNSLAGAGITFSLTPDAGGHETCYWNLLACPGPAIASYKFASSNRALVFCTYLQTCCELEMHKLEDKCPR